MSETSSAATGTEGDRLIYTADVCADVGVGDRCLRKWIVRGYFPPPDANLRGRNCWRLSTFRAWKAAVFAGEYSQARRPGSSAGKSSDSPMAQRGIAAEGER